MDDDARARFDRTLDATIALHQHMREHARPVLEAAAAITGALKAGGNKDVTVKERSYRIR